MATIKPIYCKDNGFGYINATSKWCNRPFHRFIDFQKGTIGQVAQASLNGLDDCWDIDAGGSTYSDEVLFNGKQVCRCSINANSWGDLYLGGAIDNTVNGERDQSIWMRVIANIPSSFDLNEAVEKMKWLRQRVFGVGHTDIYLPAPKVNYPGPLNLNCEAHTADHTGAVHQSGQHNGNNVVGEDSGWVLPYDEWFEMCFEVHHDHTSVNDGGLCVARVWIGDELIDTVPNIHSMLTGGESIPVLRLMNYFNAPGKSGGGTGVTKDMHLYVAEFEATNVTPEYTDSQGNPKLPTRM